MVTTFYPPHHFGGDAMHIYRLSNDLAKRGHRVDVFHCEDSYTTLSKSPAGGGFENHRNVRVFGLRSGAGILSPLLTQQTGRPSLKNGLKKALDSKEYDVIHYNNMSLIGITALKYGCPRAVKLYTTHEHWLVCPMHVLWKFGREVCTSEACIRCQVKGGRPPQMWRYTGLLKRMLTHIDCFLSPSRFTMDKHLEKGLDIPIRHMPYYLPDPDGTEIDPPTAEEQGEPFFLFVGRLEKIKGVQNLIPLFRDQQKVRLLIAGDGNFRRDLEKLAGDSPSVRFLGKLDQTRLRRLYAAAKAVIVPSICYETFGIIIIEAFAHRTPVIVNRLGALPEVVEESGGGFVYETQDELRNAVEKLSADEELRRDLGESGYDAYRELWSEPAHLKRYLSLVRELLLEKESAQQSAAS